MVALVKVRETPGEVLWGGGLVAGGIDFGGV